MGRRKEGKRRERKKKGMEEGIKKQRREEEWEKGIWAWEEEKGVNGRREIMEKKIKRKGEGRQYSHEEKKNGCGRGKEEGKLKIITLLFLALI